MKLDLSHFKDDDSPKEAILYFREEYRFLSNMFPCKVILPAEPEHGLPAFECSSTENAYMGWKTTDVETRAKIVDMNPKQAKEFTHEEGFEIRQDDSPEKRIQLMYEMNKQKYSALNPKLKEQLIATGDAPIYEGNIWGDTFWGIDLTSGTGGLNHLGRILMKIRQELQENN